jgi:hypothetical protein
MTYAPAPTTFDDLIQLTSRRGSMSEHRFVVTERSFELQIGGSTAA